MKINQGKLNRLQALLPEGFFAPTSWLVARGYPRSLLAWYVRQGWLASPARGVYRRPGPPARWQYVVASLQMLMGLPLHVGGRTALVHRGLGHYARLGGPEPILLYGPSRLPSWVNKLGVAEQFVARPGTLFSLPRVRRDAEGRILDEQGRPASSALLEQAGLTHFSWEAWPWDLFYASEERAILEVLGDVPTRESVYEADALMQGLVNLRPRRLMTLLKACRSVKVKRLFLALAERRRHAWLKRLTTSELDLGTGKRALVKGGKLDPKYLITLPADLDAQLQ
ncbi:MAG: type IV toxin-antitoxin system AbiEi family antitoxin domain-containing protein [Burkholderiales bacterium]